jgi:hypothetical protein
MEGAMSHFLAVYTMPRAGLIAFRTLPKAEQDAVDKKGIPLWEEWEKRTAAHLPNLGGMVGKTRRVTRAGVEDASNTICGYVIVEAEDIDQAARLFADHPHFTLFSGDGVDIMPFLTGPDLGRAE